jgi:hypothetical protein
MAHASAGTIIVTKANGDHVGGLALTGIVELLVNGGALYVGQDGNANGTLDLSLGASGTAWRPTRPPSTIPASSRAVTGSSHHSQTNVFGPF